MSNKIDEFLTTVQRCEVELQEEYETRQRRMAAARARRMTSGSGCMSRPRPQGARSASTASVNSANRTLDFSKQPPGNRRQSAQVNKSASSMTSANRSFNGTPTGPTSRSFSNGSNQMAFVKQPPLPMRAKVPRRRPGASHTYASASTASSRAPLKATSAVAVGGAGGAGGAVYPVPDTSKIGSRLKEDKTHYQPPRRRRRPNAKSRWCFVRKMFE